MRRIVAVSVGLVMTVIFTACTGDSRDEAGGDPVTARSGEVGVSSARPAQPAIGVTAESEADLYLWVSNQSFVDDPVRVTVSIDGTEVVDQDFYVEGQHNWILFPIEAPPGRHVVTVGSDTGAEMQRRFMLPEAEPRHAVIDYWFYEDEAGRHFTWTFSFDPVAFD